MFSVRLKQAKLNKYYCGGVEEDFPLRQDFGLAVVAP